MQLFQENDAFGRNDQQIGSDNWDSEPVYTFASEEINK